MGSRFVTVSLVTALCNLACGDATPTLSVSVRLSEDAPALSTLARLRMVVRRCDDDRLGYAGEVPLEPSMGAAPEVKAAVTPGVAFYVWLQGWAACEGPCKGELEARAGDCLCFGELTPPTQRMVAEGCTGWITLAGGALTEPVTLAPTRGLCPPAPLEACGAP